MATRYGWSFREDAGFFHGADAQVVGEHLEELIEKHDEYVTPDEILVDARHAQSPINTCFTWDDKLAAEKWRKVEAKRLTSQLVYKKGSKSTHTRAFVYVHHPKHGGKKVLMSTRSALGRPEFKEELDINATKSLLRSLTYWTDAYGGSSPTLKRLAKELAPLKERIRERMMADAK